MWGGGHCDWVCHSRVTAQAEDVREWGAEEDVWALEGSDRRLEKST